MAESDSKARSMTFYLLNLDDKLFTIARLATADPNVVLVPAEPMIQALLADLGRDPLDSGELAKFGAAAAKYSSMEQLVDEDVKRVKTFAKKLASDAAGKEYEGKLVDMAVHQRRHVPMLPTTDFVKLARKWCNLDKDDLPETLLADDATTSFVDGIKFRGRNRGGVTEEPTPKAATKRSVAQRDDDKDESDGADRADASSPSPKKKAKVAATLTPANGDAPQPKKRGRPPKNPQPAEPAAPAASAEPTPPKKVGRPPKAKPQAEAPSAMQVDAAPPKAKRTRKTSLVNNDEDDEIAPTPPRPAATSTAKRSGKSKLDSSSLSLDNLSDILSSATGDELEAAYNAMQARIKKLEQMRAEQQKAKQLLLDLQTEEGEMSAMIKTNGSLLNNWFDKMFEDHARTSAPKESHKSSKKSSSSSSAKDSATPKATERNAAAGPLSPTPQPKHHHPQPPAASPAKTPAGADAGKKKKRAKKSKSLSSNE